MPKWSSYITRFLLLMLLCALAMTAMFFGLSSYYFNEIYAASTRSILTENLRDAGALFASYQAGEADQAALWAAVNPAINGDESFFMLLDESGQALAYTKSAAPYFAGDTLPRLRESLRQDGEALARNADEGTLAMFMGQKVPGGYVLTGRPMRIFAGAALTFRTRLLISMMTVLCMILLLLALATRKVARPARLIAQTAARLTEGEQVLLPENLPGQEIREVAKALNHMSRTVAKAFQELRQEKESMALILEGLSEGILAVDENGHVLHENAAARELLGGDDTAAYRTVMDALTASRGKSADHGKLALGSAILYYAISPLPAESGDPVHGAVALIRDITEQEHLERTRHDYVANISHELRTPLASIRGLAEGLRDGLVTSSQDQTRYLAIIVDEANRLSRLVNDLLELSSLQSNPAAFEMERVDPNELIYDLHDRNGSLFAEKKLSFLRSLPQEPLPDIRSNEDRLAQVLTIFLDNARKFTPEGGAVTLGAEKAETGVRFFVRDTGIGMDAETCRLAFERFHQAEPGRSGKGSGLGLSIAREILQKLGVTIQLTSTPGKGSEFSFTIGDESNPGKSNPDEANPNEANSGESNSSV